MAFMAGNIKSLLAIKIKARHDSYSDQFSRIFAAKMFVVASLVMGIDWFHDTVSCIIPKDTNLEKDYVHSACWITGFYVYPELEKVMKSSSYYGIPKHIQIDGFKNGTTKICQTAVFFCSISMDAIFYWEFIVIVLFTIHNVSNCKY